MDDGRTGQGEASYNRSVTSDSNFYVRAALALQGYEFDDARIAEIVLEFSRIEAIAQILLDLKLACDIEPAPVFVP